MLYRLADLSARLVMASFWGGMLLLYVAIPALLAAGVLFLVQYAVSVVFHSFV